MSSVDWSITSGENSGTTFGSGTASGANLTDTFISTNQFGYDIDKITVTGLNVPELSGATYWLNLQNAAVPSGDPVFWDENSGVGCGGTGCPSSASESAVGTIASEAFTIGGGSGTAPRLSPAASCCSVLESSAWLAYCAASCSKPVSTEPTGREQYPKAGASGSGFYLLCGKTRNCFDLLFHQHHDPGSSWVQAKVARRSRRKLFEHPNVALEVKIGQRRVSPMANERKGHHAGQDSRQQPDWHRAPLREQPDQASPSKPAWGDTNSAGLVWAPGKHPTDPERAQWSDKASAAVAASRAKRMKHRNSTLPSDSA